ncbi:VTC domain-containing protein [Acetobacterium fimetarium]|uniref:VTC domain-containing protein n=1 Tax=Acetobacterium fimetarium TaxID=52691 RepID=A0ABR6WUE3_9FIRM|nr:polyphosphate polymerase domain-containing protein [Acetobacterium fimetarium]MBC3804249.1 VTC domain-containing protein [Acetobacterium fimetarium]
MPITTFKRYEKKYQLDQAQLNDLMPVLLAEMKPDIYADQEDGYAIYNIYYDTDNYDIIRRSLAKPYYKEKLRLRSYTIPSTPEEMVFLELKKKIGGIVSKRRACLKLNEAYRFISKREYPSGLNQVDHQVLREIEYFLENNHIEPKAYISYERTAFIGKNDPNFRITFDRNIRSRQTDLLLEKGNFGNLIILPNHYIMEIKILGAMPLWLAQALSELKIYSSSFSKYGKTYKEYASRA